MLRMAVAGVLLAAVIGCAPGSFWTGGPQAGPILYYGNPVLVPVGNPEWVWENLVDVVDDYFKIDREEPVRAADGVITEGALYTFPMVGSTLLEPWRHDAANSYEKLEGTLQTVRRSAIVRVLPAERGYWVDVAVFKQLEDVREPLEGDAGAATFRYDSSLTRVVNPVGEQPIDEGWIPLGRDAALEQRIIGQLLSRVGTVSCR
jgi:hypothetical protein